MKKSIFSYFSYLVLLLLAIGTLSSCDPTETIDAGPTITVNPTSAEIEVGQSADFTYNVVSDKNLEEIRIISRNVTQQTITSFTNNDSHNGSFTFPAAVADAGTTVTVTIEAVDKNSNRSSQSVDIKINAATVPVDPIAFASFPAILLAGQGVADKGSFLDVNATSPNIYLLAQAKANAASVDLAYLQGGAAAAQGAVIGSPRDASIASVYNSATNGVQTWSVQNNTRFRNTTLTKADFDNINGGSAITTAFTTGTQPNVTNGDQRENSASRVNQLSVNTVFAFRTADGKDALAHVASIVTGETGSITLNVKVVK
jgi:hypothetical protein